MKRKLIAAALVFFIGTNINAQQPLSINEVIALSLQNNYDIQLTRSDSLLTALDLAYANYSLLPRLNANGGYLINSGNRNEIRGNGDKGQGKISTNNLTASLNLNWTLYDGLRMFIARDRLRSLVGLSELQIKNQIINTVADVMLVYYNIVRQEQQQRAIEEQIALSSERLQLAQYKFEVGTGVKPDVLQAQIDLNAQRSAQLTQQTNIQKLKEQLNQLLVLPLNNNFLIADTNIAINRSYTLDSINSNVTTTNTELLIAQKSLDIAALDLRLRRAERLPVVEFNSAYNFNRTTNNAIVNPVQQNQLLQIRGLNYGVTASIPIFNGFTNKRLIKVAELNIESQKLLYDRSFALINTNLANSFRDYQLYLQVVSLEEENIKLVRENLYIARERYRLGVTTFLEMRIAEQSLADAAFRLIQARYNAKIAEIELQRLRGEIVR